MKHLTRYRTGPRQEEDFYWPGDRVSIEVWDHCDEEWEEDTGLLDARGNPIIRIIRHVPPRIGFVWPEDND